MPKYGFLCTHVTSRFLSFLNLWVHKCHIFGIFLPLFSPLKIYSFILTSEISITLDIVIVVTDYGFSLFKKFPLWYSDWTISTNIFSTFTDHFLCNLHLILIPTTEIFLHLYFWILNFAHLFFLVFMSLLRLHKLLIIMPIFLMQHKRIFIIHDLKSQGWFLFITFSLESGSYFFVSTPVK